LIYFKGDIAATYLVIGAVLVHHWAQGRQRFWAWPVAAGMFLYVMASDSRAAQLGALVAVILLLLARRWRFPALHGGVTALALIVVVALAAFFDNSWARRKLHGVADRLQSVVDVTGTRTYTSEESFFKGDNNRFRLIWWKNVVEAAWHENPVFGLGFGADLAHDFVQEYYPDLTEDFGIRSPHNVFITIFGRLGFVGLAVWGIFCAVVLGGAWRTLRRSVAPLDGVLWCAVIVILCSATFGVVLEGPMGAVVFWTLLGLAGSPPAPEASAGNTGADGKLARDEGVGAAQPA
jgi:O-antigen ligase